MYPDGASNCPPESICNKSLEKSPTVVILDPVVVSFRHVDLARIRQRNAAWVVKLAIAAAVATPLIEKRDLRGGRVDQLRL